MLYLIRFPFIPFNNPIGIGLVLPILQLRSQDLEAGDSWPSVHVTKYSFSLTPQPMSIQLCPHAANEGGLKGRNNVCIKTHFPCL